MKSTLLPFLILGIQILNASSLDDFAAKLLVPLEDYKNKIINIDIENKNLIKTLSSEGIKHPGVFSITKNIENIWLINAKNQANLKVDQLFKDSINFLLLYLSENQLTKLISQSKIKNGEIDNFDSFILLPEDERISEIQIIIKEKDVLQYIEKKPIGTINAFYEYKYSKSFKKYYLEKITINRYEGIERIKEVLEFKTEEVNKLLLPTKITIKIDQSISLSAPDDSARVIKEELKIKYQF
jgi:hypothetical protein